MAAKARSDHPCRKAVDQRDFTGTESVTDEKVVVNVAEVVPGSIRIMAASQGAAARPSYVVQTVMRSELYQNFPFAKDFPG